MRQWGCPFVQQVGWPIGGSPMAGEAWVYSPAALGRTLILSVTQEELKRVHSQTCINLP